MTRSYDFACGSPDVIGLSPYAWRIVMAFRFKLDESVKKAFRRTSREQFNIALSEMDAVSVMPPGVHQTRKVLKRLRALLRLTGPALGKGPCKARNAALRDIGRMLSGHRDMAVLNATLAKLEANAAPDDAAVIATARSRLAASTSCHSDPLDDALRVSVRDLIVHEAKAFEKLTLNGKGFGALAPGLEETYRLGRKAYKEAYRKPGDEAFHELRKLVQSHWRQMSILAKAWPEAVDVRIGAARELSEMLGDDHDLSTLMAFIHREATTPPDVRTRLEGLVRAQQANVRRAAEPRLARLYAEQPQAFVRRATIYWSTAGRMMPWPAQAPSRDSQSAEATPAPEAAGSAAPANGSAGLAAKTPGPSRSQRRP